MNVNLVMTILGTDRTGLVRSIAEIVANQGGNWLESRMTRLAGHFAGVLRISCPQEKITALEQSLAQLENHGLHIKIIPATETIPTAKKSISLEIVGNDRPGIIRTLTHVIAENEANIEELTTNIESAPMSGHPIFRAISTISIPENADPQTLVQKIETLSDDLTATASTI